MRFILATAFVLCGSTLYAQNINQDQSIKDFVSSKLKEMKSGYSVGLDTKQGGVAYLPVWTIHDSNGDGILELLNVGAEARQGQRAQGFIGGALNVVYLSSKIWGSKWAQDHVTRTQMPPLFVGFGPVLPLDVLRINQMTLKNSIRAIVSLRFDGVLGK